MADFVVEAQGKTYVPEDRHRRSDKKWEEKGSERGGQKNWVKEAEAEDRCISDDPWEYECE